MLTFTNNGTFKITHPCSGDDCGGGLYSVIDGHKCITELRIKMHNWPVQFFTLDSPRRVDSLYFDSWLHNKLTSYFVAGCVIDRKERIENPLSARLHAALANILDKVPSYMLDDLNPYIEIIHSLFEEVKEFDETESDYS